MNIIRERTEPFRSLRTADLSHIAGQRVHAAASAISRLNSDCFDSLADILIDFS
jgi:hypothetical protein